MSFYPFVLHEISVLIELILGHLRYLLTDVPPQPNSPPDNVFSLDRHRRCKPSREEEPATDGPGEGIPLGTANPPGVLSLEEGPGEKNPRPSLYFTK